jgi:hypothetical protein
VLAAGQAGELASAGLPHAGARRHVLRAGRRVLGIGVALGLMAHGFLLTDANHRYAQLVAQDQDEASIRAALALAAAGRPLFAVLGAAGSVAIAVALSFLSEFVFGARGP